MTQHPDQRFARRNTEPKTKSHRTQKSDGKPALRPVEQTLFIILSENHLWHLVDEFKGNTAQTSAMEQALRRRGVTIRRCVSPLDGDIVQVWAHWSHPVPRDVAPWMVRHNTKASKT